MSCLVVFCSLSLLLESLRRTPGVTLWNTLPSSSLGSLAGLSLRGELDREMTVQHSSWTDDSN